MEDWLDFPELIDKVQEYFDLNLFDNGLSLLDKYKDFYQNEWEIYFLYSRAYSEQNKTEKAISYLHKSLKIDKDNIDCLLGLFYAYSQMDQMQKSVRYLMKAKKLNPGNELVVNALIWYYAEINNFSKAVSCFEKSKSLLSNNSEALRNAGIAYERIGEYDKALRCFKASFKINPEIDETRDLLADHYILRDEVTKSIDLYRDYLSKSPKNIKAMSRLIFCLSQDNQIEEAKKVAQDIISIYPNSPVGYVDLSYVFLNNNNINSAIEMADKALDVSPIDSEALRVKGIAYSELDENERSEKMFKKALSLSPDNPEIMRDYYHHLRNAEKYIEMEKLVQKVIKNEHPYCMEDYWFFADYFRDLGQNHKAFHYLTKAYRCMPGEKDIIPPMVEILLEMGHISFATPILKRYIESKGWDNIMIGFARNKKLRGKRSQEGLRFLQFYGQKPVEFRKFIFAVYIKKFIFLAVNILTSVLFILSFVYFSYKGALIIGFSYCGLFGIYKMYQIFISKLVNNNEKG